MVVNFMVMIYHMVQSVKNHLKSNNQVLPSDLFGCFKWPFQGLSDLHLGDQEVTWKKLEIKEFESENSTTCVISMYIFIGGYALPK